LIAPDGLIPTAAEPLKVPTAAPLAVGALGGAALIVESHEVEIHSRAWRAEYVRIGSRVAAAAPDCSAFGGLVGRVFDATLALENLGANFVDPGGAV
jgi:hypothetical protein